MTAVPWVPPVLAPRSAGLGRLIHGPVVHAPHAVRLPPGGLSEEGAEGVAPWEAGGSQSAQDWVESSTACARVCVGIDDATAVPLKDGTPVSRHRARVRALGWVGSSERLLHTIDDPSIAET